MNRVYYILIHSKFGVMLDRQITVPDCGLKYFLDGLKEEMNMRGETYIVSRNLPDVYLDTKNGICEYKKG